MSKRLVHYFLLAFIISWVIWLPLYGAKIGINLQFTLPFHHAWGSLGPVLSALIISYCYEGISGVQTLVRRLFKGEGWIWVILAVGIPLLILFISGITDYWLSGYTPHAELWGTTAEFPIFTVFEFFIYNFLTFGLGEELGWRGYALPRLQHRYRALPATIILSVGWAVWHIPLFLYRPGYSGMRIGSIAGWYFSLLMGAIILTWIFNSSRGNLLACVVFHAMIDIIFTSNGVTDLMVNIEGGIIGAMGLVILLYYGRLNLSTRNRIQINT